MKLLPWFRRPARRAPARPTSRLRLERLEDRCVPTAVGFSTALPGEASATAVDAAGDTYVSVSTYNPTLGYYSFGVSKFGPSGQLLASNPSVAGAGAGIALDAAGDVYVNKLGVITELDPTLQSTLFSVTLPGAQGSNFGANNWGGTSWSGTLTVAGGKIYAVGAAGAGLPTTSNAYQTTFPGAATGLLAAYVAVIDPSSTAPYHLSYCSYLGGTTMVAVPGGSGASASGVAVDSAGAVYLTGSTDAADFPTTAGAFQTVNHGGANGIKGWNAYVAKIDPTRSGAASLVYSTFLGGSSEDGYVTDTMGVAATPESSPAIAVDASGNAYVAGSTTSTDFPTTAGAFQRTFAPVPGASNSYTHLGSHGFVSKLNPTGTALVYSTFLGGNNMDGCGSLAADTAGDVWVTGWTQSTNFPVTAGAVQSATAGAIQSKQTKTHNDNAFVVELDPTGATEKYGTYWGGSQADYGMGIALDTSGDTIVAGELKGSGTYPTTPGAYQTSGNGFLLKLTPSGSATVAMSTTSAASPTTTGAFQQTFAPVLGAGTQSGQPGGNGFIAGLNSAGTSPADPTLLGGNHMDGRGGLAAGDVWATGWTQPTSLPVTAGALQPHKASGTNDDAFAIGLDLTGLTEKYGTYWGSSEDNFGMGIALDTFGDAIGAGKSSGTGKHPTTHKA